MPTQTRTVTITWASYASLSTLETQKAASLTFEVDNPIYENDHDLLHILFTDTNSYEGDIWDLIEPRLPDERSHTAISPSDQVTIDDRTYSCEFFGWKEI